MSKATLLTEKKRLVVGLKNKQTKQSNQWVERESGHPDEKKKKKKKEREREQERERDVQSIEAETK